MRKHLIFICSLQYVFVTLILLIGTTQLRGQHENHGMGHGIAKYDQGQSNQTTLGKINTSNIQLVNQDGQEVVFGDLISDKVVAINFIFTTCRTICPPMGANFARIKELMQEYVGDELAMISISIDPVNDTPERLKAWAQNFDKGSGWTLLTGDKISVDQLLKDLKVFTPLKEDHSPIMILGEEGAENWVRTNGLASPSDIEAQLKRLIDAKKSNGNIDDRNYFSNVILTNQHNKNLRLYEDLLKNKIVFINPFFKECTGACPAMHKSMMQVQNHLGDRLGQDVVMLSFTVDPENDTPDKLKAYANQFGARQGWHFLTGSKDNVKHALTKLGKYVEFREQHDTIILIGNVETRLWKKANGLAPVDEIIEVLETVINDKI